MDEINKKIYIEKQNEKSIEQLNKIIPNIFDGDLLNIDKLMNELSMKKFLSEQQEKKGTEFILKRER